MSEILALPPAPSGYSANDDFVGVWAPVILRKEPAGVAFFARYEVSSLNSSVTPQSEEGAPVSSTTEGEGEGEVTTHGPRKKKGLKDGSITGKVKDALETDMDLYQLLGATPGASLEDLKRNYRKLALIFHPDKETTNRTVSLSDFQDHNQIPNPQQMTQEQIKHHFIAIQTAFEILSDETCRKQYDSSLPFDESLPSDITTENFFQVCRPAFEKEAKWSARKPVPPLGDINTPIEQVRQFYRFWADFESWRDFSQHGEFKLEEAESREERRWMQKENWRIVSKFVKQERQRIISFVSLAETKDPRIIAQRQAELRKKEEAKAAKNAHKLKAQQLEAEKRSQAEKKLKEIAEAKAAIQKRQADKARILDLRRRIRRHYRNHCVANEVACDFTSEELDQFCLEAGIELLQLTFSRIDSKANLVEDDQKPASIAKVLKEVIAEFNANKPPVVEPVIKPTQTISTDCLSEAPTATPADAKPKATQVKPKPPPRVWDADMLSTLSKALVKFPGGYPDRWGRIARFVGQDITPEEAIAQAKTLSKAKPATVNEDAFEISQKKIGEDKKKINAPIDKRDPSTMPDWTTEQQSALEKALAKHPSSLPAVQRWNSIAADVPGKSTKECIARFKEIRDAILAAKQQR